MPYPSVSLVLRRPGRAWHDFTVCGRKTAPAGAVLASGICKPYSACGSDWAAGSAVPDYCCSMPPIALIDRRRRPLSSASMTLTRTGWPTFSNIVDVGDAVVGDLGDVQQAVAARQHLHDSAEIQQAQHRAVVDLAHFDVGGQFRRCGAGLPWPGSRPRWRSRWCRRPRYRSACRFPRSAHGWWRRPCRSRRGSSRG